MKNNKIFSKRRNFTSIRENSNWSKWHSYEREEIILLAAGTWDLRVKKSQNLFWFCWARWTDEVQGVGIDYYVNILYNLSLASELVSVSLASRKKLIRTWCEAYQRVIQQVENLKVKKIVSEIFSWTAAKPQKPFRVFLHNKQIKQNINKWS